MLHILFLILKIIGIILLTILGILVLAVCITLFAPARYQVQANTTDGIEKLSAQIKAHWFLHVISAFARYENKKFEWQVRILWKKFNNPDEEKKENQVSSEAEEVEEAKEEAKEETNQTTSKDVKKKAVKKDETQQKQNWFEKIKYTILKIYDKLKSIWEMKEKITDFLTDEIHQAAFQRVKKEIIVLAKRISPRTIKGFVRFGFEDPYNTGRVLAVLSVLYPFYGDKVQIYPEFERKVLEGDVHAKGSIRGIHLLIIICNLLFDRNIRKTYKDYKSFK